MARRSGTPDYLAIAKQRGHRPAKKDHFPRILVYGRNKKGKTTFSLSAGVEKTLIVDPEKGTDLMVAKNPHVWPVTKWEDMQEVWGALRTGQLSPATLGTGKEKEPFEWVAIDGLTKINNMALKFVGKKAEERDLDRQPGMVDRRDYNKSGELMKDMLNNFHGLKMGVIFSAQERMTTLDSGDHDEDTETTYFIPDLPAGVRGAVNGLVEVIGRIYVVKVETKAGPRAQRRLQIGVHERYDTGYRSDYVLPDMIKNPTIPKLVSLLRTGDMS